MDWIFPHFFILTPPPGGELYVCHHLHHALEYHWVEGMVEEAKQWQAHLCPVAKQKWKQNLCGVRVKEAVQPKQANNDPRSNKLLKMFSFSCSGVVFLKRVRNFERPFAHGYIQNIQWMSSCPPLCLALLQIPSIWRLESSRRTRRYGASNLFWIPVCMPATNF